MQALYFTITFYDSNFTGGHSQIGQFRIKYQTSPKLVYRAVMNLLCDDKMFSKHHYNHCQGRCFNNYMYISFFNKLKDFEQERLAQIMMPLVEKYNA